MRRMLQHARLLAIVAAIAAAPSRAPAQSLPAPIESQQLQQLDAWSVGALARGRGALPDTLWSGADAAALAGLFDRLPANYESPAVQTLARRVLLSGGAAPQGDAQAAVRKRFEGLGKMGAADELATMAAGAGAAATDPVIATYAAQAELSRGRRVDACVRGRAAVTDQPSLFLLRLRAYCAAATGDRTAADLALELARGAQPRPTPADETWFRQAIAAIAGTPAARPPAARYDNSLNAQVSIAANLRPGANPLSNASNLALVALARAENAPPEVRAAAVETAFRRGLVGIADTRAILRAAPAPTTAAAATAAPTLATALRQVEAAPGSLAAASAIAGVLRASTTPASFGSAARFFREDIAALTTAPDRASTLLFARAAIASGDVQLAQRIIASARQSGAENIALAPLEIALAAAQNAQGAEALAAAHRRVDAAGASLARSAARDITILSAIGFPLDGELENFPVTNAPAGGVRADQNLMAQLDLAVQRRSLGEAGLLAVLVAGASPARLDAPSLASLLRAMRAAGLEADARNFAVEALLAGAPPAAAPAAPRPAAPAAPR